MSSRAWLRLVLCELREYERWETPHTRSLPRFQRDGAVRVLAALARYRGAVLADGVGLGKTHIASAVVRSGQPAWPRVLVVAPAALLDHWRACLGVSEPDYGLVFASYAMLSRGRCSGQYDLLVFDEAHRLRNPKTRAYRAAASLAMGSRVLLITATPLHNAPADLAALLRLFWPTWVPGDDLQGLRSTLSGVLVRRGQHVIETIYPDSARRIGAATKTPDRSERYVTLPLSQPLEALISDLPKWVLAAFPDRRERRLHPLIAVLLAKRAESSPVAVLETLRRCRRFLERSLEAQRQGRRLDRAAFRALFTDPSERYATQSVLPFFYDHLDSARSTGSDYPRADATEVAMQQLDANVASLQAARPNDDPKLVYLSRLLADDRPSVVMTAYVDTARYLFRHLPGPTRLALLTGADALVGRGTRVTRRDILAAFGSSDGARMRSACRADVLIATDVAREGVNLQRARRLVHYDQPWNPMITMQRSGRIDRIDSPHSAIEILHLQGPAHLEERLGLYQTLARKQWASTVVLAEGDLRDSGVEGQGSGSEPPLPDSAARYEATDDPGLDHLGLLLAVFAAVEEAGGDSDRERSEEERSKAPSEPPGWLLAFRVGGLPRLTAVGALGQALALYPLLRRLITDDRRCGERPACPSIRYKHGPPPPKTMIQTALRTLQLESDLLFWMAVAPRPEPRNGPRDDTEQRLRDAYLAGAEERVSALAEEVDGWMNQPVATRVVGSGRRRLDEEDETNSGGSQHDLFAAPRVSPSEPAPEMRRDGRPCHSSRAEVVLTGWFAL